MPQVTATPEHRLRYLDGWRGLSILMVLMGHFLPVHVIDLGAAGVEMFFVLSGRLMADILFHHNVPLARFYVRRFSRVWPGLFVYVLFCWVIFRHEAGFLHVDGTAVLAALTFTTNYKTLLFGQTQLMDHTWSLSVEEHSYLMLGVLSYLYRNKVIAKPKDIILFLAVLMALNGIVENHFFGLRFSHGHIIGPHRYDVYWRSDIRCASVFFAAFVFLQLGGAVKNFSPLVTLLPLLAGILTFFIAVPEPVKYILGTGCFAFAVCSFEMTNPACRAWFSGRVLTALGMYSYSIYIWQQLFYKAFQHLRAINELSTAAGLILRPSFVLGACVLGVLSYYAVERPARRFINERWEVSGRF